MLSTGAMYASASECRTTLLQNGLAEIVNVIKPTDANGWATVKTDSERLLKVWYSNEDENSYAKEVVDQLLGILKELSTDPVAPAPSVIQMPTDVSAPAPAPSIVQMPTDASAPAVAMVISEKILHIADDEEEEEEEEEQEEEEEEEEQEADMEVEQIFIRGRSYWLDANTQTLYANNNEDIGDEVGAMVNGKPVFLSP